MFFYVTKAWQSSITYENSRSSLIVALFTTYLRECANMTFNLHKILKVRYFSYFYHDADRNTKLLHRPLETKISYLNKPDVDFFLGG